MPELQLPDEAAVLAAAAAACADEPIRIPGSIQPHGHLLGVRPDEPHHGGALRVVVASRGAAEALGPAAVVGGDLAAVSPELVELVRSLSRGSEGLAATADPVEVPGGSGSTHHAVAHASGGLVLVELEPAEGDEGLRRPWHLQLPPVLRRLQGARSVLDLARALATGVRGMTGFDRVMVYRFDEDWNGQVLAEDRRADLTPFLGLRYPASDIPTQARALYARQWLRIIPTSSYEPVPLEGPPECQLEGPTGDLDLSMAVLRSVSPVHLQYLRNMGVASSMSVSLLDGERLWGLIACHHYAGPHRPSVPVRTAAEFLGRTASLLLPTAVGREVDSDVVASSRVRARLTELVAERPELPSTR